MISDSFNHQVLLVVGECVGAEGWAKMIVGTNEIDEQMAEMSDTQIVLEFRNALVALYPILHRLSCLENDTQPYDDFDAIAESIFEVVVARSFKWKYGLGEVPKIPRYGFVHNTETLTGYIEVGKHGEQETWRFVHFIGDRDFGEEIFNVVEGVEADGKIVVCGLWSQLSFRFVQS